MKRVSVRLVPVETRSFKSDDFFIWLHHVTSCIPACLVNVNRCIYPESRFLRIASLRLGSGVTKFLNRIFPTWFPFILSSLMRVARFFKSGYILNLYHKISQMHATRIEFYERVSII